MAATEMASPQRGVCFCILHLLTGGCLLDCRRGMSESKATIGRNGADTKPLLYVVDDEPMLLELACVILEPLGYAVKTFRDPDSAIEAFKAADPRPALVITDYAMHALNGMDLLRACRKLRPKQKILLISGTVGEEIFYN